MKTVNLDSKNNPKPNTDNIVIHTCGICGKVHSFSLLIKTKRVRFLYSNDEPRINQIAIDCTYCGCTSYEKDHQALCIMRYYFNLVNPEYAKSLTASNVVRASKEYFDFIKTLEQ